MQTMWTTRIYDSVEEDQWNWYCAAPKEGVVHASGDGGPCHVASLEGPLLDRLRFILNGSNKHLHILLPKEQVKKMDMTKERWERILFLVTLGMKEGPWPPC